MTALVTFDLFSALIDSRTGGSAFFGRLAGQRGWALTGTELYDDWDRRNKLSQLRTDAWMAPRLRAYKPRPEIYLRAAERADGRAFVHVASSARGVRGALEAGLTVFQLARPGHALDPRGPAPGVEIRSVGAVADQLASGSSHR